MDDLRRAMGPIVTDIGNMFIEMANTVVAQLTRLFDFINKARTEAASARRQPTEQTYKTFALIFKQPKRIIRITQISSQSLSLIGSQGQ